jgi:glycosyltransferase involved in cell wall biosynthesis
VEILEQWKAHLPLTVVVAPGANISTGRNIALQNVSSDIVAVTDAGVTLDPAWLENLVCPLVQKAVPVDVSSGFFLPETCSDFEAALAATTLPDIDEIDSRTFLPSSRSVAFRRSWFEAGIQYPEWLDYCEDLVFDLRLKRAGARFVFQARSIVSFRPRSSLNAFWRQYYHYARGDGKAGLFLRRHALRYFTYLALVPSLFVSRSRLWRAVVILGALGYLKTPVVRLWKRSDGSPMRVVQLIPLTAFLRAFGDIAKMVGYPVGLWWRHKRHRLRDDWRTIPESVDRQR